MQLPNLELDAQPIETTVAGVTYVVLERLAIQQKTSVNEVVAGILDALVAQQFGGAPAGVVTIEEAPRPSPLAVKPKPAKPRPKGASNREPRIAVITDSSPIASLELPKTLIARLESFGIKTVGKLCNQAPEDLTALDRISERKVKRIAAALAEHDLELAEYEE